MPDAPSMRQMGTASKSGTSPAGLGRSLGRVSSGAERFPHQHGSGWCDRSAVAALHGLTAADGAVLSGRQAPSGALAEAAGAYNSHARGKAKSNQALRCAHPRHVPCIRLWPQARPW